MEELCHFEGCVVEHSLQPVASKSGDAAGVWRFE